MTITVERTIATETIRVPEIRDTYGPLADLSASIRDEGLRHCLTLWKDGTLISGSRRLRAVVLLGRQQIQAVYVDTIEDAAKRLLADHDDDYLARPMTATDTCRLWAWLRRLDEPAAALRADAARRRGVELRRQTAAGQRPPGRVGSRTEDHVLTAVAGVFGFSEKTAQRLWTIYSTAYLTPTATDERRAQARAALTRIDAGESSISGEYARLTAGSRPPTAALKAAPAPVVSADATRQLAAWNRSLPQLEGLTSGLTELGPPNPSLAWEQVGPIHERLMVVRRDLEKIIKKMRESNQS